MPKPASCAAAGADSASCHAAPPPPTPSNTVKGGLYTVLQVDCASGIVTVSNEGQTCASFHVCARPQGGAEHAPIPDWLDVHPTSGELRPQVSSLARLIGQPLFRQGFVPLVLKGARAPMLVAQR